MLVLSSVKSTTGFITLNRPDRLNALNLEMVDAITETLIRWRDDPQVTQVVIKGEGRAFCAGGDLRAGYEAIKAGDTGFAERYFKNEYEMNRLIHHYPKPYVAICHGATMGGGVGVSIHGSHRIATENSVFSMPETRIGFFPDVGAAYFLDKAPGEVGTYLALTGAHINAFDGLYAGFATHFVPSAKIPGLLKELEEGRAIDLILNSYVLQVTQACELEMHLDEINRNFSFNNISDILAAMESSLEPFIHAARIELQQRSPNSLAETLSYLRKAEQWSIDQVIDYDYQLSLKMSGHPDFMEGIRAMIIDKDKKPTWIN